jgi:uncharacterized repeat protein (TIGR01451 family)
MGLCVSITKIKKLMGMKRIVSYSCLLFIFTIAFSSSSAQVISAGGAQSLVICNDGTVKACGPNSWGELGDGTTIQRTVPVSVNYLIGAKLVSTGPRISFAVKDDGTAWAWGFNGSGILGLGDTLERHLPTQIDTLSDIIGISSGYNIDHVLAVKSDGTVWAWGDNSQGELGDGTTTDHWTPMQIPGLTNVIEVSAGSFFSTALKSDGTVWAWGYNQHGQLGTGDTLNRLIPTLVNGLSGIVSISSQLCHSLAIKNDGTVWAWGDNLDGQLGDGSYGNYRTTPVQTSSLTGIVAVDAGSYYSLALKSDGTVWGWGHNTYGQIGDSSTVERHVPVQTYLLNGIISISAGQQHSLALRNDGTVWSWGAGFSASLGDSALTNRRIPVQMHNQCSVFPPSLHNEHFIHGFIYSDTSSDCIRQSSEGALPFLSVFATPDDIYCFSNDSGYYSLGVNDSTNYNFAPLIPQLYSNLISNGCPSNYSIFLDTTSAHDTSGFDFGFNVAACWQLRIEINGFRKRRCFPNYTSINYWNEGFIPADSVKINVKFAQYDIPISASLPYIVEPDSSLVFNIGTLQSWQTGTITIIDSVACVPGITGLTQCTKAWILPPNQCLIDSTTGSGWDHSSVSVDAACVNDTCRFVIRNSGSQDMDAPSEYRIYANNVLVYTGSFQLVSGDSLVVLWVSNGATIRLEADQVPGHPGNSHPRATLEACGDDGSGNFTIGEYNRAPMDDEDVDVEIDCMEIRDSYDPNDKSNSPLGVDAAHIVLPNTPIDYTVRFQNTGTDTAYKVVVIDSISNDLELATLELGASSHPYSVSLSGQGIAVLKFTFNNINLVDSTTDELNSHGLVKYKIAPKSSVPLGTQINNAADIYFDYNFPVRTNTAFVTLGNYLVLSSGGSKMTKAGSLIFYPNPTSGDITIESAPDNLLQRVSVYSYDGRLVKSLVISHSSLVNVDMTELSAGVYFMDCKTESGSEKIKIVRY